MSGPSEDPSVIATEFNSLSFFEQLNKISRQSSKRQATAISGYVKFLKQAKTYIDENDFHMAARDDVLEEYTYNMGDVGGECVLTLDKLTLRMNTEFRFIIQGMAMYFEEFSQNAQDVVVKILEHWENQLHMHIHAESIQEDELQLLERVKRLEKLSVIELPIDDIQKFDIERHDYLAHFWNDIGLVDTLHIHTKQKKCYSAVITSDKTFHNSLLQCFDRLRKFRQSTWILLIDRFLVYISEEGKVEKLDFHDMYVVETVKKIDSQTLVLGVIFKTEGTFQKVFIGCNDIIHKWIQNAKITQTERLLLDKHSAPFDGRLLTLGKEGFTNLKNDACFSETTETTGKNTTTAYTQDHVPGFGIRLHIKTHTRLSKDMKNNALMAARLRHFAIVPVYAVFFGPEERISIISACFNLENLRNVLDYGRLDMETRVRILYHIACAIEFLHTPVNPYRGVVLHLDISSVNIVLDNRFNARLIDFGSSRELPDGQTHLPNESAAPLGRTPGYYPEGPMHTIDKSWDYFSFAVVMREVLTGENPAAEKCKHGASLKSQTLCECFNFQRSVWQYVKDDHFIGSLRSKVAAQVATEIMKVPMSHNPNSEYPKSDRLNYDNPKSDHSISGSSTSDSQLSDKMTSDRLYYLSTKLIVTSTVMHILETDGGYAHNRGFRVVEITAKELKENKNIWGKSIRKFFKDLENCFRQKNVIETESFKLLANLIAESLKHNLGKTDDKRKTLKTILKLHKGFDKKVLEDKMDELDEGCGNSIHDTVVLREAASFVNEYIQMDYVRYGDSNSSVFECVDNLSKSCLEMHKNAFRERPATSAVEHFSAAIVYDRLSTHNNKHINNKESQDVSWKLWEILHVTNKQKWNKTETTQSDKEKPNHRQSDKVLTATPCDVCLINEATKVENIVRHRDNCKDIHLCITCIKNHYFNPIFCPLCRDCQPDIGGYDVLCVCVSGADNDSVVSEKFKSNAQKIMSVFSSKVHHTLCISNIQQFHASNEMDLKNIRKAILQPTVQCKTLVFHYCGHGAQKQDESSLKVTNDFEITQCDLNKLPERYYASKFIAVLDCCYAPEIKNAKSGLTILQINSSQQHDIKYADSHFTDALIQALLKSDDCGNGSQLDSTVEVITMPDLKNRTSRLHETVAAKSAAYTHANISNQNVSFCSVSFLDITLTKTENKKVRIHWDANWKNVHEQVQCVYFFETDWLREQCKDVVILRNNIDSSGQEIGTLEELWKALERKRPLCVDLRRLHDIENGSHKKVVIYLAETIVLGRTYTNNAIDNMVSLMAASKDTVKSQTKVVVKGRNVSALNHELKSSENADDGETERADPNKAEAVHLLKEVLNCVDEFGKTISGLSLEFYFNSEGCKSNEQQLCLIIGMPER